VFILSVLFLFLLIIGFHETGHFLAAKAFGVYVKDFFIGFGPGLQIKGRETNYHLGILMIGGAVNLAGEQQIEEGIEQSRQYQQQNPLVKAAILLSGAFFNIILAIVLFMILFSIIGVPTKVSLEIKKVLADSPAFQAGIRQGDIIARVNQKDVSSVEEINQSLQQSQGKRTSITVLREDKFTELFVSPEYYREYDAYLMGTVFGSIERKRVNFLEGVKLGFVLSFVMSREFVVNLLNIQQISLDDLSGPVGIVSMSYDAYQIGLFFFLFFCAMFSINIGLFNLLPIPPLDGGKVMMVLLATVSSKSFAEKTEKALSLLGVMVLLFLLFLVTYRDIFSLK